MFARRPISEHLPTLAGRLADRRRTWILVIVLWWNSSCNVWMAPMPTKADELRPDRDPEFGAGAGEGI